jgi:hypothetical protein
MQVASSFVAAFEKGADKIETIQAKCGTRRHRCRLARTDVAAKEREERLRKQYRLDADRAARCRLGCNAWSDAVIGGVKIPGIFGRRLQSAKEQVSAGHEAFFRTRAPAS